MVDAEIKVSSLKAIRFRCTFAGKAVSNYCVILCLMMYLSGLKVGVQQFQMKEQTAGLKTRRVLLRKWGNVASCWIYLEMLRSPYIVSFLGILILILQILLLFLKKNKSILPYLYNI